MTAHRHARTPLALVWAAGMLLAIVATTAAPGRALASCAVPPGGNEAALDDAEIVFVGSVLEAADAGRLATVAVEEIWRGPDLGARVLVRGGFATGDTFTSADRIYETGTRYLFAVSRGDTGELQDSACSPTAPWTAELAAKRPSDARSPVGSPTVASGGIDVAAILAPLAVVLAVAAVLLGVGLAARSRGA